MASSDRDREREKREGLRDGDRYSVFLLLPIRIERPHWTLTRGKSGSGENISGYCGTPPFYCCRCSGVYAPGINGDDWDGVESSANESCETP